MTGSAGSGSVPDRGRP